jgi:uncharacterized protein YdaT
VTVIAILEEIASSAGQYGVGEVAAATIREGYEVIAVVPIASILAVERPWRNKRKTPSPI